MARLSVIVWAVAMEIVVATNVAAQHDTSDSVAPISAIRAGQKVRVALWAGSTSEGRFVGWIEPDKFRISGDTTTIHLLAVRRIWVQGRATKTGALGGAVALGFVTGMAALSLCGAYNPCSDRDAFWSLVLGGGAGAVIGGVVGGLIGAAFPVWRTRYPSEN